MNWWSEHEQWKAFPREGALYDQPKEWLDSVSAVRAAKNHHDYLIKNPAPEQGAEADDGGGGRGAIGGN